jgi:hypothetical protein
VRNKGGQTEQISLDVFLHQSEHHITMTSETKATNEKLNGRTPGTYLRWHTARQTARRIAAHLAAGGRVVVATYTRATYYDQRHAAMFRATRTGLFVQRGKAWDCIDGCAIRFVA